MSINDIPIDENNERERETSHMPCPQYHPYCNTETPSSYRMQISTLNQYFLALQFHNLTEISHENSNVYLQSSVNFTLNRGVKTKCLGKSFPRLLLHMF